MNSGWMLERKDNMKMLCKNYSVNCEERFQVNFHQKLKKRNSCYEDKASGSLKSLPQFS